MEQGLIIRIVKTYTKSKGVKVAARQIFLMTEFSNSDDEACYGFGISVDKHPKANAAAKQGVAYVGSLTSGVAGGGAAGLGELGSGVSGGGGFSAKGGARNAQAAYQVGVRSARPAGKNAPNQMATNRGLVAMNAGNDNLGTYGVIRVTDLTAEIALTRDKRQYDTWSKMCVQNPGAVSGLSFVDMFTRGKKGGGPVLMKDGEFIKLEGDIFMEYGIESAI